MPADITLARDGSVRGVRKDGSGRVFIEGESPHGYAISPTGMQTIKDDVTARLQFIACATDFRAWLDVWQFSPPGGSPRTLGSDIWASEETFAQVAAEHPLTYFLKARQLGLSTCALGFDAWVLRMGPPNARVIVCTQRESNAIQMIEDVLFGLTALPDFLRLPVHETARALTLTAGKRDRRVIRCYPAGVAVRGQAASHVHLDELAAIERGDRVWGATEPIIVPGGTAHLLTTGVGPVGFAADEWRRAVAGESRLFPCFIPADQRPSRTPQWFEAQRKTLHPDVFRREYALTPEDALAGSGDAYFSAESIDKASQYCRGNEDYQPGRKYLISCDFGRYHDASVFHVLDITEQPIIDVVHSARLVNVSTPQQQLILTRLAERYHADVVGESNYEGGILENLDLPANRVHRVATTGRSKPEMLERLYLRLENGEVCWDLDAIPHLTEEMRMYRLADSGLRTDSVMSLAVGLHHLATSKPRRTPGRLREPFLV